MALQRNNIAIILSFVFLLAGPLIAAQETDPNALTREILILLEQENIDREAVLKKYNQLMDQAKSTTTNNETDALFREYKPLIEERIAIINEEFISGESRKCANLFLEYAQRQRGVNALQDGLIDERIKDRKNGGTRDESVFSCFFILELQNRLSNLFSSFVSNDLAQLTKRFNWLQKSLEEAPHDEWIIFDAESSAVGLNAAGDRIVITQPMAEAFLDVAVIETFGSYEALEQARTRLGKENEKVILGEQLLELSIDMRQQSEDEKSALRQQFQKAIMGNRSPEEFVAGLLRGEKQMVNDDVVQIFGDKELAKVMRLERVLGGLISFALLHEIGHILSGHTQVTNPICEQIYDMEIEADAFAASILGKRNAGIAELESAIELDKAGLTAFYKRFFDFGFAIDSTCPHPPIEERFKAMQEAYGASRKANSRSIRNDFQEQFSVGIEKRCAEIPEALRTECKQTLKKKLNKELKGIGLND
ncbi:hypothetical protein SAMN05216326_106101 [Nitrosomonas marina]|uniref:Peptidase family M48 n=1 Tax=Nitrosomonas marina TaxID=917 RepID=A0A1I0A9L0_9PROT|nr:hypothetical protein [Nitrosomonas marina]SES90890.1 hypothetical protein SAMN05216326_106101 [Nitrosomonas marina]